MVHDALGRSEKALPMETSLGQLKAELQSLADPERARILSRFFKTGKGQYGEGDVFLGITVPGQRSVAKRYHALSLEDIEKLLLSGTHEHRLAALLILVIQYKKADDQSRRKIIDFYLSHTGRINNWDLVDLSAEKILGDYLVDKDKSVLYGLAQSRNLWERRIAIIATFAFIKRNVFEDTLRIAGMLLDDHHDLIHKAAGWMLREIGKRDLKSEEAFLQKYHGSMPRTMLRYAIERFAPARRIYWMSRIKK
jgi:3-methyladenine DNA glycosylase AlkD